MKRWWAIVVLIVTVLWSFHSTVFAEDCPACDMSPPHIQTYEAVMEELIWYIATAPKESSWQWNISLAVTSALDAALTSVAIARILPVHTLGDIFWGVQMLAWSKSIVRDRQIFIRLDQHIWLQTLAMIQWSRNSDIIPKEVLDKVDASLKRLGYVKLRKTEGGKYTIQGKEGKWATYWDLATLLRQLNYFYKQIHLAKRYNPLLKGIGAGYWKTDSEFDDGWARSFANENLQTFIVTINGIVAQTFSPLYGFFTWPAHERLDFNDKNDNWRYVDLYDKIREVQKQYDCSIGLKSECSERKAIRKESFKLAKDSIINDGNKAINTFKNARGRLKDALGQGSSANKKAAQQRDTALKYSQRWPIAGEEKRKLIDVDTHIEPAPQTVSSLRKTITRVRKKKSDRLGEDEQLFPNSSDPSNHPIADSQKDAQQFDKDPIAKLQEQVDALSSRPKDKFDQQWIWLTNTKWQIVLEQETQRLQQSFASVLSLQAEVQEEDIFIDVKRTTHRFPLLSAAIYKNIDIIGAENDNGKLYNAMWSVCDQQCTNLGPTCRYPTQ